TPVKASRLFAGYEHEQEVKKIAAHFNQSPARYRNLVFDTGFLTQLENAESQLMYSNRNLDSFSSDVEAYHHLMFHIVKQQEKATQLVLNDSEVKRIFVDGGFSKNSIYMNLLSYIFPEMEVFAASVAQAKAMGTALAIHDSWNRNPLP